VHKIFRTDGLENHDRHEVLRARFAVIRVTAKVTIQGPERVADAQFMRGRSLLVIEARREPLRQSELERELILADFRRHSKLKREVYDLVSFSIFMHSRNPLSFTANTVNSCATTH